MTRADRPARRPRVAIVGSLNMDLVVRVERLPAPGETILGGEFLASPGGKGANQAVAAARAGAAVVMLGRVGRDAHGRALRGALRAETVDVLQVLETDGPSGVALILVARDGENVIAVAPGANALLSPGDVANGEAALDGTDAIVAQLEVPLDVVAAVGERARARGVPFFLNAAPALSDARPLLSLADVLVVNDTELAMLTGARVEVGREPEAAAALLAGGTRVVVVTVGERGAYLVSAREQIHVPAFQIHAVDTTAAGDTFVGALSARYRGPDSLESAARFASAAAALACTRMGAQSSIPSASGVVELLHRG